MESKRLLDEFVAYCEANPTDRFWQALRNWSGHNFILASKHLPPDPILSLRNQQDTFHWSGRDGME